MVKEIKGYPLVFKEKKPVWDCLERFVLVPDVWF